MKYIYKIENLDCANCAAKAEAAVSKLEGVRASSINLFALKMILETEAEMTDGLLKLIKKTLKRIEPEINIKEI